MSHETGSTFASTRVVLCGRCRLSHETWFALTACGVVLPRQMSRSRGRPASRFDIRVSGFHGATWRGRTVEVRLAQHISSEAGERACAVRRNIILYDRKVKGAAGDSRRETVRPFSRAHAEGEELAPWSSLPPKGDTRGGNDRRARHLRGYARRHTAGAGCVQAGQGRALSGPLRGRTSQQGYAGTGRC